MGSIAVSRGIAPSVKGMSGFYASQIQAPSAQTDPVTSFTWYSANVSGEVQNYNNACFAQFEYGTTAHYGKTTPVISLAGSGTNQQVTAVLLSLAPNTLYHVRLKAFGQFGTGYGEDQTFTTQTVGGAAPGLLGTAPIVTTTGILNLTSDSVTLQGTGSCGTSSHPPTTNSTITIGLRRKGVGAGYAFYSSQSIVVTTVAPVAISVDTGHTLLADTDYEYVVTGLNQKCDNGPIFTPPFAFHTPPTPPPPGVPPLCDTTSVTVISGTEIDGVVKANHNNADPLTGYTDVYVYWFKTSSGISTATQVGPLNPPNQISGTTDTFWPFQITGLANSTNYTFYAFAVNNYGSVDDSGSSLNATTSGGATGTLDMVSDSSWVASSQATVFCNYTTPASGSFQIRFGYKLPTDTNFTYTAYESVPISTTQRQWDQCINGLIPGAVYIVQAQLFDGTITVSSLTSIPMQMAAAISHQDDERPTFPGFGPGSRGSPLGQLGSPPTIQNIPTYADVRRPSSGLISETNERTFKSNISYHPTYAAANKLRFSSASDAAFVLTDGVDLAMYGTSHGVVLTYPGNGVYAGVVPQPWDIEIWDPEVCKALGTTQPPHVIRNSAAIGAISGTHTTHGRTTDLPNYVFRRYSRWGDVAGIIGQGFQNTNFCVNQIGGATSAQWGDFGSTTNYRAMVGLSLVGLVAKTSSRAACGDDTNPSSILTMTLSGKYGCVHNLYYKNVVGKSQSAFSGCAVNNKTGNSGSNDGSYTLFGYGGLVGWYDGKWRNYTLSPSDANAHVRVQNANYRYDFRRVVGEYTGQHQIYIDNPSAHICGDEGGVAAPSFFISLTNEQGHTANTAGDTYNPMQIVARKIDNTAGSTFNCPTGCSNCGSNTSIGPDGAGLLLVKSCSYIQNLAPQQGSATYVFVGHQGEIVIDGCTGNSGVAFFANSQCNQQLRPVVYPDGNVGATLKATVKSYTMTGTVVSYGVLTFDSVQDVDVTVSGLVIPAGLNAARYPISLCVGANNSDTYKDPTTGALTYIQPCGSVKLRGVAAFAGWPTSGKKVDFAPNGGGSTSPPMSGHVVYSNAELAIFDPNVAGNGVCRAYLAAPLTQPGSFTCVNDV